MKNRNKFTKKTIKKRIELNMGVRDKFRVTGRKPLHVALTRNQIRRGVNPNPYRKKAHVDYDVVICIPSHERYKKVKRLITQFLEQPTKYSLKIVLLNDGSKSQWYDKLPETFPQIVYLKNDEPNGKLKHWYCYSQMWEFLKDIECHAVLQMDDDFILCDNFLDTITDTYFERKNFDNNIVGISPHTWSFRKGHINHESWWNRTDFVDGISLLDPVIIEKMNYIMHPITSRDVTLPGNPVGTWDQINEMVHKMGGYYYRTPMSLVYHDGNNDSKLHADHRINGKGVYTKKLIQSLKKYHD